MEPTNWSGNYRYRARVLHRPATLEQLQGLIASRPRVRVLGSRHTFTGIADSDELVTLDDLGGEIAVDGDARTVTAPGHVRYGELATALEAEGLALANLASLPHISVAGAVATGTHGSGDANGVLGTSVAAVELVRSDGELIDVRRGDDGFDGVVVGLGALGAITRITLDVEPAYEVRQRVFETLAWEALVEHLDAITARGYSVSAFSRWGETVEQVWVKSRVSAEPEQDAPDLFGAPAATVDRHPIIGLDPVNCTPQLGAAGLWSERLPHFRMGFTPSSGQEIQSEYIVPRRHAAAAIEAMRALGPRIGPLIQVSELRTIAADELWMSPAYRRDALAIHFTWVADQPSVEDALVAVEAALIPLQARPHWGKLFLAGADVVAPLYERHGNFVALARRFDPRGAFVNAWLERCVLG